jgi:hypothetical protein
MGVADLPAEDGVEKGSKKKGTGSARRKRRSFAPEYKLAIVAEYEMPTEPGARGALLRREGPYHSHVIEWTRARDAGALNALAAWRPARNRPRPRPTDSPSAGTENALQSVPQPYRVRIPANMRRTHRRVAHQRGDLVQPAPVSTSCCRTYAASDAVTWAILIDIRNLTSI